MKGKKLFTENKSAIEQAYNRYRQDYDKYIEERNALLTIMKTGNMGDRLCVAFRTQIHSRIKELNRIIDELYEVINDISTIYNYYGYKEERGRRRKD